MFNSKNEKHTIICRCVYPIYYHCCYYYYCYYYYHHHHYCYYYYQYYPHQHQVYSYFYFGFDIIIFTFPNDYKLGFSIPCSRRTMVYR